MQVIAADLDQAQQVADFLQKMLDDRENQLHTELYQTDMNNQMISKLNSLTLLHSKWQKSHFLRKGAPGYE